MKSLFRKVNIPIIALPGHLLFGAALLILLAAVTNAAGVSTPGEALYPLRVPALRLLLTLPHSAKQHVQLENLLVRSNGRQAAGTSGRAYPTDTPPSTVASTQTGIESQEPRVTARPAATVSSEASQEVDPTSIVKPPATQKALGSQKGPTPQPMLEPTEQPKPEATAQPTEQPKPEATAQPTEQPKPEATAQPTEQPKPEATAQPTEQPKPSQTENPEYTPEPQKTPRPSETPGD